MIYICATLAIGSTLSISASWGADGEVDSSGSHRSRPGHRQYYANADNMWADVCISQKESGLTRTPDITRTGSHVIMVARISRGISSVYAQPEISELASSGNDGGDK